MKRPVYESVGRYSKDRTSILVTKSRQKALKKKAQELGIPLQMLLAELIDACITGKVVISVKTEVKVEQS